MRYRVWDTDINRLFGTYEHEEDALALVRTLVGRYGEGYAADLSMGGERDDGSCTPTMSEIALLKRAENVAAEREQAEIGSGYVITSHPRSGDSGGGGLPIAAKGMVCRGPRRVLDGAARPRRKT